MFCGPAHTDSLWPVLTRVKSGQAQFDAGQNGPGSQVGLEQLYEPREEDNYEPNVCSAGEAHERPHIKFVDIIMNCEEYEISDGC